MSDLPDHNLPPMKIDSFVFVAPSVYSILVSLMAGNVGVKNSVWFFLISIVMSFWVITAIRMQIRRKFTWTAMYISAAVSVTTMVWMVYEIFKIQLP